MLNLYRQSIGALNYILFAAVLLSLPFPWAWTQPIATAWLIAWGLEGRWLQRKNWTWSRALMPIVLMVVYVAWEAVSLLWTQDVAQGLKEMHRHLPLLGLALVALCGTNEYYRPIRLKVLLVAGCLLSIVAYTTLVYWCIQQDMTGPGHMYHQFSYWTFFAEGPVAAIKHRLYYCLVLLLGLWFSGDIYRYFRTRYHAKIVLATVIVIDILLVTTIILTGCRIVIFFLPIMVLVAFVLNYHGRYRWALTGGLTLCLLLCLALGFRYHQRLNIMKQDLTYLEREDVHITDNPHTREPRLYIWYTIVQHAKEYGICGLGCGSADGFLQECYLQDEQAAFFTQKHLGAHNQFLYTWMELGPLAVVLLLAILCLVPYYHTCQARKDALFVSLMFGCCMLTETLLTMMSSLYVLYAIMVLIEREQRDADSLLLPRP